MLKHNISAAFKFLLLIFILFSCNPSKMIVGKWKFENLSTTEKAPKPLKAKHEAMLKEVAKASYMNFYKDMQYEICLNNKITKGTWNFDNKTKLITSKQTGLEKEDKLHITELESDKIKLYFIEPGGDTITIRLIKISD